MKTTIELDESKLKRVMKLTGIKTRKKAIEFALSEAERIAKINKLFSQPFFQDIKGDIVDPDYDPINLRNLEKPS